MLMVGEAAPDFELPDADMNLVSLSSCKRSKVVVLYFYPKDDTPGCTLEAIDFSELQDDFQKHDAVVMGISRDDCLSHGAFRDKHGISVQLLADTEGDICEKYGVMHDKEIDGKDVQHRQAGQRSPCVVWRQSARTRGRCPGSG